MDMFFIDRFMCSEVCPCHVLSQPLWEEKYEEQQMKKRLRTYKSVSTPPTTSLIFIGTE
jgi:D-mannonate dehydratase